MNKQDTIPIVYGGGTYGTFVEWCLMYFSGQIDTALPFGDVGDSHYFVGNNLFTINGWRNYLKSNRYYKLVRFHPKTKQKENSVKHLEEILESVNHVIFLYANEDSFLLNINNKFDKIWDKGWVAHNQSSFLENLSKWDSKNFNDMQRWEIREFLSFYIWKQHLAESDIEITTNFNHKKIIKTEIRDLVDRFEITIRKLLSICDFTVVRNNFSEIYNSWIILQKHIYKDNIVKKIVDCTVNLEFYDWSNDNLSVVDEAIIQMQLRDLHNLDLRCYNLNLFPTNTENLRKLLMYND